MLKLEFPNESHKFQWEEIIEEWDDVRKNPRIFFQDSFETFLGRVHQLEESDDQERKVAQSSVFLLADEISEKVIGCLWIRHHIDFPHDQDYGGHIGYGVRPSARGKGYATKMLTLGLQEAKKLGINSILITCDDENIASAKVIEANGGVFERYTEKDGVKVRRYWIEV